MVRVAPKGQSWQAPFSASCIGGMLLNVTTLLLNPSSSVLMSDLWCKKKSYQKKNNNFNRLPSRN